MKKSLTKPETKHFGQSGLVLGNLPSKNRIGEFVCWLPTNVWKTTCFFWDCRRALIFRKPLTSPQEIYLEPSCRVFVAGTGRRDFASWLMHFGYVSNLGVSGTATFSKLELKPQQKPNKF